MTEEEKRKLTEYTIEFTKAWNSAARIKTFVCTEHKPWYKFKAERHDCPICTASKNEQT